MYTAAPQQNSQETERFIPIQGTGEEGGGLIGSRRIILANELLVQVYTYIYTYNKLETTETQWETPSG